MCASCGCGEPNASHGDQRHITYTQMQDAATASDMSPMQVAQNMLQCAQEQGGSSAAMKPSSEQEATSQM